MLGGRAVLAASGPAPAPRRRCLAARGQGVVTDRAHISSAELSLLRQWGPTDATARRRQDPQHAAPMAELTTKPSTEDLHPKSTAVPRTSSCPLVPVTAALCRPCPAPHERRTAPGSHGQLQVHGLVRNFAWLFYDLHLRSPGQLALASGTRWCSRGWAFRGISTDTRTRTYVKAESRENIQHLRHGKSLLRTGRVWSYVTPVGLHVDG